MNKFVNAMDKYFKFTEKGSTFKTEVIAGLTTFMTMAYILMVNSRMFFENIPGVSYGAMYITTALAAVAGTLMMALYAKLPFAQAPGMGLNAFFVFTVCGAAYGLSFANALVIILFSGVLFTVLTVTGLRSKIVKAIPACVKIAIPAGIGLFIAFVGLQGSGLIISDAFTPAPGIVISSTIVKLVSFNIFAEGFVFASILKPIVTIASLILIAVLASKKVKGAMIYGIIGGAIIHYAIALPLNLVDKIIMDNPLNSFVAFGKETFGQVFTNGFTGLFSDPGRVFSFIAILLSFTMVDMFDTIGTLVGTAKKANMLDADGNVPNMNKALLADSVATIAGGILGTSTVTTYVESSAGVAEGGRSGLTALVVALCFFVAMFLTPIAQLIPGSATAAALIYVGVLMMSTVVDIDWSDAASSVPAFLTITMMAFTYNISYGIAFGFLSYTLIKLFTGKIKDISILTAILTVLFLANFFFVAH